MKKIKKEKKQYQHDYYVDGIRFRYNQFLNYYLNHNCEMKKNKNKKHKDRELLLEFEVEDRYGVELIIKSFSTVLNGGLLICLLEDKDGNYYQL